MKLKAFRIKNYRSIVDSGWNTLAYDNITALIGQNESGKTSVLEALKSFYEGVISDDVLRSDLSLPTVECKFSLENEKLNEILDFSLLPQELVKIIEKKEEVILSRDWEEDKSSRLRIGEEDILKYYCDKEQDKKDIEKRTQEEINKLLSEADSIVSDLEMAEKEKEEIQVQFNEAHRNLEEAKKALRKAKKPDDKLIAQQQFASSEKYFSQKEAEFHEKVEFYEEKKTSTQELSEKVSVCKLCNEAVENFNKIGMHLEKLYTELKDVEHYQEMCTNEKEKKAAFVKLTQAKTNYREANIAYFQSQHDLSLQRTIAAKVLAGKSLKVAESEALRELEEDKKYYNAEDIGKELFSYVPYFEFFEDFSSLLPNKIDLEDVLAENVNAEGYKAAKNFLMISGLTPDFFREKNHRILKQKIENLNGEITINFQDYWRQNVGKNNKIRLNFELEHYDYTVPEKSGKPYLEFWIKDQSERLYPKQRSRGVRWFLSFYLELKATAKKNSINRVLLIDEPGLSLHARAQEDVLKVFEDLKDDLQIIYCTHSPHLVDARKLYRILAVQRANEDDETSETIILDINSLHDASNDTLSPIYSLMGVKLNEQQFIHHTNNVVIEDPITYYYLVTIARLLNSENEMHFIPATGISDIPVLINILTGWKLDYFVFLMDNETSNVMKENLKKTIFLNDDKEADKKIIIHENFVAVEDIFSTIDFKKYVLNKRVGITESNYEYIENNGISRTILASGFVNQAQDNNLSIKDFDQETQSNFKKLFKNLSDHLS